jgi:hypothetical protein
LKLATCRAARTTIANSAVSNRGTKDLDQRAVVPFGSRDIIAEEFSKVPGARFKAPNKSSSLAPGPPPATSAGPVHRASERPGTSWQYGSCFLRL